MKYKSIFIILAIAMNFANAQETTTASQEENTKPASQEVNSPASDNGINAEVEDKIYQLLSGGKDPFSYGTARGSTSESSLVPIDISNVTTTIKLKGVFKLSIKDESYALVQVGEGKNSRRQLVHKGDLILLPQETKNSRTKSSKYLQIIEIRDNTIVIAPQMRPDEQIVIR